MKGTTVFFDLETGGTEPYHPTIQLAAVAVRGWKEIDSLERKIAFKEEECDPAALDLNGYDRAKWFGAVSDVQAAHDFCDFCRIHADWSLMSKKNRPYTVARLAGHNIANFDIPRVQKMMNKARVSWWYGGFMYPFDTLQRCLWKVVEDGGDAPANYQLQTLASHFDIPRQGAEHEALADVRTTVLLAKMLVTGSI